MQPVLADGVEIEHGRNSRVVRQWKGRFMRHSGGVVSDVRGKKERRMIKKNK